MINIIRHKKIKVITKDFLEVFIKIDVKDNNVEQALRVLKRKLQRDGFLRLLNSKILMKSHQKKKRILQENIKRVKKNLNKLKNRI